MDIDHKKFQIDQLRKDKIIYAIEATATNTLMLLLFLYANSYLTDPFKSLIIYVSIVVAVGYTLYMGVGNFRRLQKVKRLEKDIKSTYKI